MTTTELPAIHCQDGLEFLCTLDDNTVDLILTDPPYITSRDSGMNSHYNNILESKCSKTEEEWLAWESTHSETTYTERQRQNYLQYGSIYGKKYAVRTNYGAWDSEFTMDKMNEFVNLFYRKLRNGGTCIVFFDLWKITPLKTMLENAKFKQIRFIEWVKTNPQPLNSKANYLTNCREIALVAVKGTKPTFHSSYDNGIYSYPIQGGKNRFHPTQKNLLLFKELIRKHSNEGDLVVDPFLGSGTTAIASMELQRRFAGSELNQEYASVILQRLPQLKEQHRIDYNKANTH